jgi:hypothetical protein
MLNNFISLSTILQRLYNLLLASFFVDSAKKSWWELATVDKKDDALPWTQAGNYTQSILMGSTQPRGRNSGRAAKNSVFF